MLEIGFSKESITPSLPISLGGYADRKGLANEVHDDLFVRACYLESGGKQCILLAFDLLMMDDKYYQPMQKEIADALKMSEADILLSTTHSHSAPLFIAQDRFGKVHEDYYKQVRRIAVETAKRALEGKQAGKVAWHQQNFSGVGSSRRSENRTGDVTLTILSFADLLDRPIAGIVNYNCHPTVMSADNLAVSRDYPGAMMDALEKYGIGEFIFVNGAAGDVSTRFVRKGQTFEEMKRLGELLAEEVKSGMHEMTYETVEEFTLISKDIQPPLKVLPDVEELDRLIDKIREEENKMKKQGLSEAQLRLVHTKLQGAYVQRELKEFLPELDQTVRLRALKIGKGAFLFLNAELFSGPAAKINKDSACEVVGVVGYTNGIAGYLPDQKAFEEGGYEALSCRFAPGIGEQITREGLELLETK